VDSEVSFARERHSCRRWISDDVGSGHFQYARADDPGRPCSRRNIVRARSTTRIKKALMCNCSQRFRSFDRSAFGPLSSKS
jgi:hypothetical protein